jgi:hypothetical protein
LKEEEEEYFSYIVMVSVKVLPPLLGLKQNLSRLYDGQLEDHPPPRPITPAGSDIDIMETIDMDILKTQMLVPDASNYSHNSMYGHHFSLDVFRCYLVYILMFFRILHKCFTTSRTVIFAAIVGFNVVGH